jgi:Amt family ammonium transporter
MLDRWTRRCNPMILGGLLTVGAMAAYSGHALAQEAEAAAEAITPEAAMAAANEAKFLVNNLWIMLAGCLVFIMHLGFATVESGLSASKNTVNILFKNAMIICIGFLTYALCGFNIMYPGDFNGYFSFSAVSGFISRPLDDASLMTAEYAAYTWYTDFFFQAVFAATAATIVSGAVAGRIKLLPFLVFSTIFVALCYPITGSWKWGGGFLHTLAGVDADGETLGGFYDFAGSTLVHSVGGWGALIMAILVGPRLGKFNADGSANAIPGHNLTLACIGVFLLWFGWFGFNGGSVLSADPGLVSLVLVTTSMAAAAGGVATAIVSWIFGGKPDLSMSLNGILAGLVGITAGADQMVIWEAVLIGLIAGVLVYFSVLMVDKLRVDDPVGAISVHLVCGIWGTLAVGIFGALASPAQIGYQLAGIAAIGAFTVVFALVVGLAIKATLGLRVSDAEQVEGLDLGEHNAECYPDFQPAVAEA